ncbi:MAG TPA: hypothetical protein VFT37_03445 [Telluria sp.]|nr:hypothetical protein [Telluria sp.]
MQNAPHNSQPVRARIGALPFARAVSMLGSVIALAVACAMLAPVAHGQEAPPPRQDRAQQQQQQQREMQRELQREVQRQEMLRQEQRAYEEQQRRLMQAQQEQQQEGQRRHGRMTPDERSELRRQINEANQDIYSRPRRR